jgi:hypothetical protein
VVGAAVQLDFEEGVLMTPAKPLAVTVELSGEPAA